MIQQTSRWAAASSFSSHPTLKGHSVREIVETQAPPPSVAGLKPGESMTYSTRVAEPTVRYTQDDRLEFSNGGTVEDKPNEGGLLITSPDGSKTEVPGWIDMDYEANQPTVFFRSFDGAMDEWNTWEQTFPAAGGSDLKRAEEDSEYPQQRLIHIQPNGQVQVEATDYDEKPLQLNSSLQGHVVVMEGPCSGEALAPAVPLEWFVSR